MIVEWKKEDSVGIVLMDEQHQKILNSLSTLYEEIENGKDINKIEILFNKAGVDINSHLDSEEKYLENFGCEGLVEHKLMHNHYREMFLELVKVYPEDFRNIPLPLVDMLGKWFKDHINFVDKRYTNCFHEHGLF